MTETLPNPRIKMAERKGASPKDSPGLGGSATRGLQDLRTSGLEEWWGDGVKE
jgi:hypothetical protein